MYNFSKEEGYKKMVKTKYGKYVIKAPVIEGLGYKGFGARSGSDWEVDDEAKYTGGANCLVSMSWVSEPVVMEAGSPHKHDFDQLLFFFGGNPIDVENFGAEVEISLGEEGEKHTFNAATIIYIPKGLFHAPLTFKRVDKPVIMLNVVLTTKYTQVRED
jgi:hypothetical protein